MISGKDLASMLDVAPATLSQAVSKGHLCSGYEVGEWAILSASDRVVGYEVPADVIASLGGCERVVRPNPAPSLANSARSERELAQKSYNVQSLLPPGEDYSKPVAVGGISHVVSTAIKHDTATGRGALLLVGGLVGAFAGHEVGEGKGVATVLGMLFGAGLAAFGMGLIGQEARQRGDREIHGQYRGFYDTTLPAAQPITFGGDGDGSARTSSPVVAAQQWPSVRQF